MNFRQNLVIADFHVACLEADDRNKLPSSALPDSIFRIHDVTMREVEDFESDPELNFSWEAYEKSQCPPPTSSFRPSPTIHLAEADCPGGSLREWTSAARRALARSVLSHPAYKVLPKSGLAWIPTVFPEASPLFCQAVAEVLQPVFPIDDPKREEFPQWPACQEQLARLTPQQIQDQCKLYDILGLGSLAELLAFNAVISAAYDPHRTTQDKRAMLDDLLHILERSELPWPDPLHDCVAYLEMPAEKLDARTRRCILGQKRSETISSACRHLRATNNKAAAAELEAEFVVACNARPEECKWFDTADCTGEIPRWPTDCQPLDGMKPELVEAMCTLFDLRDKRALADRLAINASLTAAYDLDKTIKDRTDMFNRLSAFLEDSDEPWPPELKWFDAYVQHTESVEDQDVQARCSTLGAKDPEAIADVCRYLRSMGNYAEAARVAAEALIGVVWANSSTRLLTMWESTKGSLTDEPWPKDLTSMRQTFIDRLRAAGAFQPG
ncbi:hypothetical protein [Variovorax guangxiensis]|uniref:hypothetical protein n=1 Tax=Variovorax guangxiensis TaxID=1775474 RepID=UPI002855EC3D|nr:hypothetical protein [Variovorax guangxiensis]MDR6857432.1 hypothetical protein [Variovorax guangxiensis]